ncbi:hypothetical protein BDR04DRAFT_1144516 [Suillus decipiens]|nr:hypothetical protein BDR04DRAFT_1144516 [Suillus decipiens]
MAESSTSAQRRDGERGVALNSPVVSAPRRTKEKDPPHYGAQYRQDALWEGGNEALPPQWGQYAILDGGIQYQDDTLVMNSRNRPLPGVRLGERRDVPLATKNSSWNIDFPGQLIPGCEWHISPLGRSYFVNHNTRTTSWKKPTPEHLPGSLVPEYVIEGHSKVIWSLACSGTSCDILSASSDGSIRQWKRDGESVGKPWGKDFWDDTHSTHHPAAPPATPLSALRWRNLLGSLRFSTRPPNTPQSIPLESRRWNFNVFSGGSSIRTVEVPAGRKKNRIYVSPPSAAEVARAEAAAAMQRANGKEAGSSTQASQPQAVSGTEVSQGRPTETRVAGGGTGDDSNEVRCCGLF